VGVFLGLLPDAGALEALGAHPRPEVEGVRWEPDERLHVTLRYTAVVHEALIAQLDEVAREVVERTSAPHIELGPATELLGRDGTLVVPAAGAEDLARLVDRVLDELGVDLGPRDHPFYGHLTLARRRRRTTIPDALVGVPVAVGFRPEALVLIVSEPGPDGSAYDHRLRARFA